MNTLPIPSGVVCCSRTTAGSEAVYICDEGFPQNGAVTRVCQIDGVWNGSIPQCLPSLVEQDGKMSSAILMGQTTASRACFFAMDFCTWASERREELLSY